MSHQPVPTTPAPAFINAQTVTEQVTDIGRLEQRRADNRADPCADAQLESVYRAEGAWPELIALLLDRVEELSEPAEIATLLGDVATVYRDELAEPDAARLVLIEAFAHDPSNRAIANALDQLAHTTGAWEEVLDSYLLAAAKLAGTNEQLASDLWLRIACASIVQGDWEPVAEALAHVRQLDIARAAPYLDLVEQRADAAEVLETLSQVCARVGDWDRMARVLSRAIGCTMDLPSRAALHHRVAELQRGLGDEDAARWHLSEALRLNPSRTDSADAMTTLLRQHGHPGELARFLETRRSVETDRVARAQLAFDAASLYAEELDEHTHAIGLYAACFAADPDHGGAAIPLAERYYEQERWHELAPVIEKLADAGPDELASQGLSAVELYCRAGRCALELGSYHKARDRYEDALALAPDHLPSLLGAADACRRAGDDRGAYQRLAATLPLIEATGESARVAQTMCDMARLLRGGGNLRGAQDLYERAIALCGSRDALSSAAELYADAGDFAAVVELKQQLLHGADDAQRVRLLSETAYLTARKLGKPYDAIEIYLRALDIDSTDREVLHQLVELHTAAEQWQDAVDKILRIAQLESDAFRRGKYYQTAGTIARHYLDRAEAIGYLNRALDYFFVEIEQLSPTARARCLEAFTDIGTMLYEDRAWTELERNYRRMLQRITPDAPEAAELWHGLGQLYRKHLRRRESAIDSFEVAAALDEDRATNHHILLDLYDDASPDHLRKSIARRQQLLAAEPYEPNHYRALVRLHAKAGLTDESWACSRALVVLEAATTDELELFRRGMRPAQMLPQRAMNDGMWQALRHPEEAPELTAIFQLISAAVSHRFASSPRQLGLASPLPASDSVCDLFNRLNAALGNSALDAYFLPELQTGVAIANVRRGGHSAPAYAMGPSLTGGRSPRDVLTELAEAAVFARPAYYLRRSLPTGGELEAALLAALHHAGVDAPVSAMHAASVSAYVALIRKRLPPQWTPLLSEAVRGFLRQGTSSNLARWARAADSTCRRAQLIVTGDLRGVYAGITRTMSTDSEDHRDAAVRDLMVFSVSSAHSQMRRALGIALQ